MGDETRREWWVLDQKLVDASGEAASLLLGGKENEFMTRVAYLAPPPPRESPKDEISEEEHNNGI